MGSGLHSVGGGEGLHSGCVDGTAMALPFIVPQILLMVHKARESEQYTRFLESGISESEAAKGELKRINELLEARVYERTLELARANKILKTSEKRYRLLFESNPMPMWAFGRDNLKFLAVNQAAMGQALVCLFPNMK